VVGSCEHGNEPSRFIKGVKILDQLCDCPFLTLRGVRAVEELIARARIRKGQLTREDVASWGRFVMLASQWGLHPPDGILTASNCGGQVTRCIVGV
jgi:hypothetical protein